MNPEPNHGQLNYIPEINGVDGLKFNLIGARTAIEPRTYDFLGM